MHGGQRKSHLTDSDLVGLGKGMFAKIKPQGREKPWLGGAGSIVDPVQSEINRQLGYWKR